VLENDIDNLDYIHSIQNILSRPSLLTELVLEGSQTPLQPFNGQTPILSLGMPGAILAAGNKISKVQNFEFFRATAHVKVMVNANPFTCGKLWITYAPMDRQLTAAARIDNKSRPAVTAYPGIELDFQVNNTVEIEIPWTYLVESCFLSTSYDLVDTLLNVYALGPLRGPGGFKVNIQVFGWLTDVVLRGPTYKLPPPLPVARFQVNKEAPGPIEQVSGVVGKTAGFLKKVPFLTEYAAPVEWVANSVNKVASIFGFSRPVEGSGASARTIIPGRGMFQNVCQDQSVVLAFSNDNTVGTEAVFLRPEDEMDISYVCSRPSLIDVVAYTTTATTDLIGTYGCSPGVDEKRIMAVGGLPPTGVYLAPTPFEFVGQVFTQWRADVHYKISVAKTAFHTGRLEIVFVPGTGAGIPDSFDATNCYRTILDLSLQNEIDFVCPFVSPYEMLFTNVTSNPLSGAGSVCPSGFLVIKPLTSLICPETVSQSVDIFVWKHAENVTFAGSANTGVRPQALPPTSPPPPYANFQINLGVKEECDKFVCYGGVNDKSLNVAVAQRVGGESVENLRPLTRAHRYTSTVETSDVILSHMSMIEGDYLSYLSSMYAYWRGGISYKFVFDGTADKIYTPFVSTIERLFSSFGPEETNSVNAVSHITFPAVTPIHEVQMPFLSATKRLLCNVNDGGSELYSTGFMPSLRITGPRAKIYRGAKDDFSFGTLIGPTLLFYSLAPSP